MVITYRNIKDGSHLHFKFNWVLETDNGLNIKKLNVRQIESKIKTELISLAFTFRYVFMVHKEKKSNRLILSAYPDHSFTWAKLTPYKETRILEYIVDNVDQMIAVDHGNVSNLVITGKKRMN